MIFSINLPLLIGTYSWHKTGMNHSFGSSVGHTVYCRCLGMNNLNSEVGWMRGPCCERRKKWCTRGRWNPDTRSSGRPSTDVRDENVVRYPWLILSDIVATPDWHYSPVSLGVYLFFSLSLAARRKTIIHIDEPARTQESFLYAILPSRRSSLLSGPRTIIPPNVQQRHLSSQSLRCSPGGRKRTKACLESRDLLVRGPHTHWLPCLYPRR